MHNAFPIADIPGQRAIRVPTFDPEAVVICPRCGGEAHIDRHAIPGNTCPCGYIELAWMAYPSDSGNVEYVAGLRAENARLRAGMGSLRREHSYHTVQVDDGDGYTDEMEEPCPATDPFQRGPCTCGADAHNARIDALLKGDG